MNYSILSICIIWMSLSCMSFNLVAQIKVGPEVGVAYAPFVVIANSSEFQTNRLELTYGFFGEIPISKKWYIDALILYHKREDLYATQATRTDVISSSLKHNDLNTNFLIYNRKSKLAHIGLGFLASRKINSFVNEDRYDSTEDINYYTSYNVNKIHYGAVVSVLFDLGSIRARLNISRILSNERYLNTQPSNNKFRYSLTMSYPIRLGSKG